VNVDVFNAFLQGGCTLACFVIGLFFLRFWRASRDRLFLFFVAAFWAFAVHWIGLRVLDAADESRHWFYVVRLVAFMSIAIGIVDKNRRNRGA
jgi:uncharacterized protein DUF5985